jgi:hypothetical protein
MGEPPTDDRALIALRLAAKWWRQPDRLAAEEHPTRGDLMLVDWISRGQWIAGTFVTVRDLHALGLDDQP